MKNENRTYEDILISFIKELNSKGAKLDYKVLTEKEQLELMSILVEECKKHMRPFVVHVLGYDWYWFHDIWFKNFKKYDVNCNVCSRSIGKTYWWSMMLPEYLSFIIPNYQTVISSYNEKVTFNFLKANRIDYEDNAFLKTKISLSKSDDWNKTTLDFSNKSFIKGISITSQIRGLHVNYFNADDIMNDDQTMAPDAVKSKLLATVFPTLERKRGKFSIVGTRFGEEDIYNFFKVESGNNATWHYCEIRVELDEINEKVYLIHETEDGIQSKTLDTGNTDLFDFKRMLTLKMTDPNYFAREYECSVVSDDDIPFPTSKLHDCRDKDLSYQQIADSKLIYAGGMDSANSTKKGADSTVLEFGHIDAEQKYVLDFIYEDNSTETPERLKRIKKHMDSFGKLNVLTEQNSMGLTNIQMLNRERYRLEPLHMDRNKKVDMTDYASTMAKLGRIRLPYKTFKDQQLTNKLIHQLSGVRSKKTRGGKHSYDGTTRHDDLYIAFILMIKQLSKSENKPLRINGYTREDLMY